MRSPLGLSRVPPVRVAGVKSGGPQTCANP